jgi:RHS repeat-associated protein
MGQEWDAELGLNNFRARMYDPELRRFLVPDRARQFSSPYVFCGDNRLSATDPSGDLSLWGRIGIGVAMGALAILGTVASVLTGGAAAPEATAGEVALGGAEAGAEAGSEVGADAAAESGADGASEESVGSRVGNALKALKNVKGPLKFGLQVLEGAINGLGTNGLQYDVQYGRTFSWEGFGEAAGYGALEGAVQNGLSEAAAGAGLDADALGWTSGIAKNGLAVGVGAVTGALSTLAIQPLQSHLDHQPWNSGLWQGVLEGAVGGAIWGQRDSWQAGAAYGFGQSVLDAISGIPALNPATPAPSMRTMVAQVHLSVNHQVVCVAAPFFVNEGYMIDRMERFQGQSSGN